MLKYSPFIVLTLANLVAVYAKADGGAHADAQQLSHLQPVSVDNPFNQGNVAVKLTPEQIADLAQYINRSQQTLEQALDDAKGLGLEEASRVYLDAVKDVVISSNSAHPRTECLMRVMLNQALALTYGVPNANGNGLEVEGVLSKGSYQELLPAILRSSIELALQYVDQDRNAAQAGQLMDLPYAELAYKRMQMSQDWMRSIFEQELSAQFGIESLQQWLNLMVAQDQQHEARYASEIDLVQKTLKHEEEIASNPTFTGNVKAGEQERLARITMRKVLGETGQKLAAEKAAVEKLAAEKAAGEKLAEERARTAPFRAVIDGMSFVPIAPGTFVMGSPRSEAGRDEGEDQHEVRLTQGFEMQATDVTQAQWVAVMGSNLSYFKSQDACPKTYKDGMCPKNPVEQVSWTDTQDFINRLNSVQDGYTYRLPTEAEWEYAARAGSSTAYFYGDGTSLLGQYVWYYGNSGGHTHEVAQLKANAWRLYDMTGNVLQWVQDWYGNYNGDETNPPGASSGSDRGIRGGGWKAAASVARSASRVHGRPDARNSLVGFRLVRTR